MKVVALISGGKDSCYNMMQCVAEGHDIVALANLKPKDTDEMDSFMFQTVGHHAIDIYAEAMGLPLYRRVIEGSNIQQHMDYEATENDEVEDMYQLLKEVKEEHQIEGVSVGAVLSDYQRIRVENVCIRLGLTSLAYLWQRDQKELLNEMICCDIDAIILKVATLGLTPDEHLGISIRQIYPHMLLMKEKYGLNICGEGGEYETFTLDCPLFNKRIAIDDKEVVIHSADAFAPVGYINIKQAHLEDKPIIRGSTPLQRLKDLPMKKSSDLLRDLYTFSVDVIPTCEQCELNRQSVEDDAGYIKVYESGNFYVSCLYGLKKEGSSPGDIMQTIIEKLKSVLEQKSLGLQQLIAVHLYVQDMKDFAEINLVYKSYFGINPPVRVCVQADLPENVLIQIDCLGHVERESSPHCNTMHVQSLSHWAPANIGPYSQAVQFGDFVYVAGQIALCPATLQLVEGGIIPQTKLSLRHVAMVLQAMDPHCILTSIVSAVCYVTDSEYVRYVQKEWKDALEAFQISPKWREAPTTEGLLEIVVVPALPRGALVEWQVYANTKKNDEWSRAISIKQSPGHYKINLDYHYPPRDYDPSVFGGLKISVELSKVAKEDLEYERLLIKILATYQSILNHKQLNFINAPGLTVFYKYDIVHLRQLSQALKAQLTQFCKGPNNIPPVTYVPVRGFENPDHVLSIVH
ncbi:unnamed protein product [Owenia fusiformis]|uniref:Diphthine--ammonia ligase n=1 Tax=Owenia fusiformis TaxID=6347 RepID=A0A8S4PLL0_OWEFU|nr:unnamed protein product [Owenia fusiformis]